VLLPRLAYVESGSVVEAAQGVAEGVAEPAVQQQQALISSRRAQSDSSRRRPHPTFVHHLPSIPGTRTRTAATARTASRTNLETAGKHMMGERDAYLQLPGKCCLLAGPSSVSVRSSPRSGRLLLLPSMSRYVPTTWQCVYNVSAPERGDAVVWRAVMGGRCRLDGHA
jgi:hypothetical protein